MHKKMLKNSNPNKASESLRLAESLTGIGYFERDWQTGEGYWSEGFCKLLGVSPENVDCTHIEFMKYVHKDDQKRVTEHIQETIKNHTDMNAEFRIVQVNGNVIDIHGRATNIYDEAGRPISTVGTFLDITERKKAEETIRKSEVQYKELVNTINSGVAVYKVLNNGDSGKDYIILSFNKTSLEIEQMKLEDVLNKSLFDIRPNIDDYGLIQIFQKVWKTGEPAFFPAKQYIDDKYANYYENRVFRLPDGNIVAIYDDVTERENALLEIRRNRERLDLALNATEDGIFDWNLITNGIYYTPSWKKILGYKDEELPNDFSVWEDLTEPEDVKRSWKMLNEMVNNERDNFEIEFKMKHKNGHWVDILSRAKAVFNKEGKAVRVIGTHVDISERKKTEKLIRENEAKFRSYVDSAPDGIFVTDRKGHYVEVNKASEEITGYSEKELLSMSISDLLTPEYIDAGLKHFKNIETTGNSTFEAQYVHKNGEKRWWSIDEVKISEKRFLGFVKDITEKKKLENSIHRTQQLESLGILAGGIAHDFNNILSAIFGFTERAMLKSSEKNVRSYLEKSVNNIERARSLTQQLLTFAKGGKPVKEIGKLFPFVKEAVKFALSGSSVSCKFSIQEDLWSSNFDRNQIGQVIDNLTINAQQSMPKGGTIKVKAQNISISENGHPVLGQGDYIKLSIVDKGSGIPKESLSRIFDPYYSTKPEGHGLGLATCYSIVTHHGGYIDAESEQDKGSTFNIYLPATKEPAKSGEASYHTVHKGRGTFIVMDDEGPIREIIRDMLESFGYDVILKNDGNETLTYLKEKAAENFRITGMIFDLTIPGAMGGKKAVKEAKKLFPKVPVFVASGYSEDPIISNPENYGFNASIRKPFVIADLSEMLEKHMKSS